MTLLEYAKQYTAFDVFLCLINDAGYTDDEIIDKFKVSKQTIYNAEKRLEPLKTALESMDSKVDKRNSDIQMIINLFAECFGTTTSSQYDRFAAKRLHVKYHTDILKVIQVLSTHGGEEFCPVVNSVSELEKKLPSVIAFLKKQNNNIMVDLT